MLAPTLLFCNLLSGILCVIVARRMGKPVLPWFLLTIPFGVLVLFLLLYLQEKQKASNQGPPPPQIRPAP